MLKFILLLSLSFPLRAGIHEIVATKYDFQNAPEYQAVMAQLKPFGSFSEKDTSNPSPAPKELSQGERAVEEAKARNRAILAERNSRPVEAKKEGVEAWRDEVRATHDGWKKEVANSLAQWKREQEVFLGRIKVYKENTFKLPVKAENIVERKVDTESLPHSHVVNGAFLVPIRDQKDRPTCSAFAGIRAIEIVLSQNKVTTDLSEQYFYWASKPNCQKSPCTERGSWVTPGLRYSQSFSGFDVPSEEGCSYQATPIERNETQLPLSAACHQGVAKIENFQEVRTLSEVVERIKKDTPVIMAAKLSENFYRNQGLVTLEQSQQKSGKLDSHAKGHAFVGVGVIELPEKLKQQEGDYCILVANSWGQGWGAGGYACLTEKWLQKYRQPSPFIAVTKIITR